MGSEMCIRDRVWLRPFCATVLCAPPAVSIRASGLNESSGARFDTTTVTAVHDMPRIDVTTQARRRTGAFQLPSMHLLLCIQPACRQLAGGPFLCCVPCRCSLRYSGSSTMFRSRWLRRWMCCAHATTSSIARCSRVVLFQGACGRVLVGASRDAPGSYCVGKCTRVAFLRLVSHPHALSTVLWPPTQSRP